MPTGTPLLHLKMQSLSRGSESPTRSFKDIFRVNDEVQYVLSQPPSTVSFRLLLPSFPVHLTSVQTSTSLTWLEPILQHLGIHWSKNFSSLVGLCKTGLCPVHSSESLLSCRLPGLKGRLSRETEAMCKLVWGSQVRDFSFLTSSVAPWASEWTQVPPCRWLGRGRAT